MNSRVIIVGTGPAALMAGTILLENGFKVHFYEQKKAIARKFLVAGHGGFNLTHSEKLEDFILKYDEKLIQEAVRKFSSEDFRNFLKKIKVETIVGTSDRVFPEKGMKPIQVLYNWKNYLLHLGAEFFLEHSLIDFDKETLTFDHKGEVINVPAQVRIFSLGGASWQNTGSDGIWLNLFGDKDIEVLPFQSSNSGMEMDFPFDHKPFIGKAIKNCLVYSEKNSRSGDVIVTEYGLESTPIYALNRNFRLGEQIFIDFKPAFSAAVIEDKIKAHKKVSEGLEDLKLVKVVQQWLKATLTKEEFTDPAVLSQKIKCFPIPVKSLRPIDEVISTVGGVDLSSINENFELKKFPGTYCIGEMLNWDAPTGGYLIQACVATGYAASKNIVDWSENKII